MNLVLLKLLLIIFSSGQGLICIFSLLSLIFVSYARKNLKEGIMKTMVENLIGLAFVTYLFTFFNIMIKSKFMIVQRINGEFILNVFIVLILIVIIKTTIDIMNYSKEQQPKKIMRKRRWKEIVYYFYC